MAANGDEDGYLWKLIAYRLQRLDRFIPALLVLLGREGSGKSTITNVIARLLAPYSITLSDAEKFVGRNNASLQGKLFVQLEEMNLGRREEYDSRLKHYITSHVLDVEEKYKAQWQVENRLFAAMTANKLSAVRVTQHSRRFAIYQVDDRFNGDQDAREDFFGRMEAELEAGGYEALAYDLLHTDLTGFSPAKLPSTTLYQELSQAAADQSPVRGWWREILEAGGGLEVGGRSVDWTTPVPKEQLYRNYHAWCEANGPRTRAATLPKAEWAKELGKLLPGGIVSKRQMRQGDREQYVLLQPYEDCCAHFEKEVGRAIERSNAPSQLKAVF